LIIKLLKYFEEKLTNCKFQVIDAMGHNSQFIEECKYLYLFIMYPSPIQGRFVNANSRGPSQLVLIKTPSTPD